MSEVQSFTAHARAALKLADKEAETFAHRFVEPEHLLLALIESKDSVAAEVLSERGVTYPQVKALVENMRIRLKETGTPTQGASLRLKMVLKTAATEAKNLGQTEIGAEHLLLAVTSETTIRESVLSKLDIARDDIRESTYKALNIPYTKREPEPRFTMPTQAPPAIEVPLTIFAYRPNLRDQAQEFYNRYKEWMPITALISAILLIYVAISFNRYLGLALVISVALAWFLYRRRKR